MTLTFDAAIEGDTIRCTIGTDRAMTAPVWCFSLMTVARVVSGGTFLRHLAGYNEVQLPDLEPGKPHEVVIAHLNPAYRIWNRAWLPLGSYLRTEGAEPVSLPALPGGVAPAQRRDLKPYDGLRLVPRPTDWVPVNGMLKAGTFMAEGEPLEAASALAERTGLGPLLGDTGVPLAVHLDPTQPPEGYLLEITPTGATISASARAGIFYAAVTLITLRQTHDGAIPCGVITDAPRFGWRGQHLDCSRHHVEPRTITRLMDLMALLKMNRFHWHFSDDEAFRLEVDCFPDLWQKTAYRGEGLPVPGVFGGGIRSGGSYTKAVAADLIAHGQEVGIEILPEVEIPAHAFAVNAVIPGLRDPEDTGTEVSIQGYPRNAMNPAMQATWDFLLPLTSEVAGMFPLGILHLGCDELAPGTWDGSPAADRLKAEHGLETRDDLQGWMMEKLAAHLAAQGIRPAAWEEAAKGNNGGLGHGALLFSWTGQGPGVAAARAGYDVVMCPAQHVYLDMAHTDDPGDWGAAWAARVDLAEVLNWSPVPEGAEDIAPRVAGVQATFWGEFTTEDRQIEALLAPRILGVATKAWDKADAMTGDELRQLALHYGPIFDAMNWDWHKGA
ncbi:MAG: beta-N-acetylhexosaminidase [Rhodobacterales bacterium]|nr:beta-N-acetylhexosaminidase [Rhodobacterales bacterium]